MTWGSFGNIHLLTLALALFVNILIYLILKRNTRSKQILALFIFSLFGVGFIVYGLIVNRADILRVLPLSFWALNVLLLPIAILTREKYLCNLLLIWSAGSILALVFNGAMANVELLTFEFIIYFTTHLFGAGIPILLFELGLVKRDLKAIRPTLAITALVYIAVHIVNLTINTTAGWTVNDGVNYMSSLAPSSGLLNFLYAIFPIEFWYMLLVVPLILFYIAYWYLPEILDERRKRRPLKQKLKDIDEYYEELEEEYIEEIIDKRY